MRAAGLSPVRAPVGLSLRASLRAPLVALALAALAPLGAAAQDAASGEFLYFTFCSTCHGEVGKGDGPTAQVLTVRPADLTALASGNSGSFPVARVISRIEGEDLVLAHGSPMPLYARIFDGAEAALAVTDAGEIATNVVVMDLVAWLETIQE